MVTQASRTAAVVVTHRAREHLRVNLPTVQSQTLPFARVVVVDNASSDGSAEVLGSWPGIEVVTLSRNRGFAGGANRGLRRVLEDPSIAAVALLNDDVALEEGWHEAASSALHSAVDVGSCATALSMGKSPDRLHGAGIAMGTDWVARDHLHGEPVAALPDVPVPVWGASGAAALLRRDLLEGVGLFLEPLFAYQEDVELAMRARRGGWRCLLAGGARGRHAGFATNRSFPLGGTRADYLNARNRIFVLASTLPGAAWRRDARRILSAQLRLTLQGLGRGRGAAVAVGALHGFSRVPRALLVRRRHRRLRVGEHPAGGVTTP